MDKGVDKFCMKVSKRMKSPVEVSKNGEECPKNNMSNAHSEGIDFKNQNVAEMSHQNGGGDEFLPLNFEALNQENQDIKCENKMRKSKSKFPRKLERRKHFVKIQKTFRGNEVHVYCSLQKSPQLKTEKTRLGVLDFLNFAREKEEKFQKTKIFFQINDSKNMNKIKQKVIKKRETLKKRKEIETQKSDSVKIVNYDLSSGLSCSIENAPENQSKVFKTYKFSIENQKSIEKTEKNYDCKSPDILAQSRSKRLGKAFKFSQNGSNFDSKKTFLKKRRNFEPPSQKVSFRDYKKHFSLTRIIDEPRDMMDPCFFKLPLNHLKKLKKKQIEIKNILISQLPIIIKKK